ncbi:MAG: transglutaminase-like cysteine peptidase [Desulfarculales bacterium]|jgi:predicted transglutaminase-like cysteine proteinase|nr:transglutaminase-like cysteine peptidase [Desulfarculales bacterium]
MRFYPVYFLFFMAFLLLAGPAAGADPWRAFMGARMAGEAGDSVFAGRFAPQWERVRRDEQQNPVFPPGGKARFPAPYAYFWNNLYPSLSAMNRLDLLRAVSGFINVQMGGKLDKVSYGMGEYFASPREFLRNHGGDCEDFAICKYFLLRSLGWASQKLRLLVVEIPSLKRWHALLAAEISGTVYIVDNNFRPRDLALPAEKVKGFFLLHYAFNEDGAWRYEQGR